MYHILIIILLLYYTVYKTNQLKDYANCKFFNCLSMHLSTYKLCKLVGI